MDEFVDFEDFLFVDCLVETGEEGEELELGENVFLDLVDLVDEELLQLFAGGDRGVFHPGEFAQVLDLGNGLGVHRQDLLQVLAHQVSFVLFEFQAVREEGQE